MKKVYFVICDAIKGDPTWDTFIGAYKTFDAAKAAADNDWYHATDFEKKNRTTYVASADVPDDIALDDAYDFNCESGEGYSIEYTAEDSEEPETVIWYAVVTDNEDNDYGTGSFILSKAKAMARKYRDGEYGEAYPDAHVVAVDDADGFALEEIHDIDD
jgi:hypothetical protein